jgi:RNA recognition motif-containing protein
MSKKLFVGNLPFDINDADLNTVIAVAGTVASAKIVINKKTGRSKGYGFVEMETEAGAEEAVKKFEGATLNERALTVQLATPKQEAQAKTDETAEGATDVQKADAEKASAETAPAETANETSGAETSSEGSASV